MTGMRELKTEILIVGGGLGGCAAAIAATQLGHCVVVTEPTPWLGGQVTSQAVPPNPTGRLLTVSRHLRKFRAQSPGVSP